MSGFNQGNLFGDGESSKPERKSDPKASKPQPQEKFPALRDMGPIIYGGIEIEFDEWGFVNITSMWRANGSPKNREPRQWRRFEGRGFIVDLAKSLDVSVAHVIYSNRGKVKNEGTWAHWQVALAYAKYLNHEFHRFVNEAFREWVEEKADPDLKARRAVQGYRDRGWKDRDIRARLDGILQRHQFTDTLKDHEVTKGWQYAKCTDIQNEHVIGMPAKQIRSTRGVPARGATRDYLTPDEMTSIAFSEMLAERGIKLKNSRGFDQCYSECDKAGQIVGEALAKHAAG